MKDAEQSLYGQGHVDATRTRECVAMPGVREQTILTPGLVMDALRAAWGPVRCDPCAAPPKPFDMECPDCKGKGEKKGKPCSWCSSFGVVRVEDQVRAATAYRLTDGVDGLEQPWLDWSFVNGPWGDLRVWLDVTKPQDRAAWLVPMRCHRSWLMDWYDAVDHVIAMPPMKFEGHRQAMPFPVVIGTVGTMSDDAAVELCLIGGRILK